MCCDLATSEHIDTVLEPCFPQCPDELQKSLRYSRTKLKKSLILVDKYEELKGKFDDLQEDSLQLRKDSREEIKGLTSRIKEQESEIQKLQVKNQKELDSLRKKLKDVKEHIDTAHNEGISKGREETQKEHRERLLSDDDYDLLEEIRDELASILDHFEIGSPTSPTSSEASHMKNPLTKQHSGSFSPRKTASENIQVLHQNICLLKDEIQSMKIQHIGNKSDIMKYEKQIEEIRRLLHLSEDDNVIKEVMKLKADSKLADGRSKEDILQQLDESGRMITELQNENDKLSDKIKNMKQKMHQMTKQAIALSATAASASTEDVSSSSGHSRTTSCTSGGSTGGQDGREARARPATAPARGRSELKLRREYICVRCVEMVYSMTGPCKYHPKPFNKQRSTYPCCRGVKSSTGCKQEEIHDVEEI